MMTQFDVAQAMKTKTGTGCVTFNSYQSGTTAYEIAVIEVEDTLEVVVGSAAEWADASDNLTLNLDAWYVNWCYSWYRDKHFDCINSMLQDKYPLLPYDVVSELAEDELEKLVQKYR